MKIMTRVDTAVSMNATNNGAPIHMEHVEGASIIVAVTATSGTLAGDLKLQASNNAFTDNVNNNVNSSATWVDIPSATAAISTTTTATARLVVTGVYDQAIRLVWTRSGGEGSYTALISAKGPY